MDDAGSGLLNTVRMHSRPRGCTVVERPNDALAAESPPGDDDRAARPDAPAGRAETFEEGHARRAGRLNELLGASRRTIAESRLLRGLFKKVR